MGRKIDALLDFIFDEDEWAEREEMRARIEAVGDRLYAARGLMKQAKGHLANGQSDFAKECIEEAGRQLDPLEAV